MAEDLQDLGEFGLIRRLVERLPVSAGVLLGPGDDAAVLAAEGRPLLATADILVQGVHFDLAFSSYSDIGYKSIAVNASDIAAMGGRPRWALVSLGADVSAHAGELESLYDGVGEAAREFGVGIVGGDTVRADRLIVSVSLIGDSPGEPVKRSGALAGDVVVVTGPLGAAAAGLALFRVASHDHEAQQLLDKHPSLARAHQRGRARIAEGQALARAGAHAMIDISDGFAADVGHICDASGVGVVIDEVPLAEGVEEVAQWLGMDPMTFALAGGDDYELASAMPPSALPVAAMPVAGRFVEGSGVRLASGDPVPPGWDHFRE